MNKKIKKYFKNPKLIVINLMNRGFFSFLPDKLYLMWKYRLYFGRKLNLNNPVTFNEKLQWLKLYDRNPLYTKLVDKYEVRKYIADTIGEEYLIPLIGIYDKVEDIDFEKLPNQFVIKCTHDSGSAIVCKNKSSFDWTENKKKIKKSLKRNYYYYGREWPYKNVKPRIIIEKYISDNNSDLNDFKYFVFNGKVSYYVICSDRKKDLKFTFFDKNNNFIDVKQDNCLNDKNVKKPKNHQKMMELARILSKDIPQLRVDFYEIGDYIFFGELTFFDSSGFGKFDPEEWDTKFGEMLKLPERR